VDFLAESSRLVADFSVVAGANAARDFAITGDRPKFARSTASKSFLNVGRYFIVVFISSVIAAKSQIFQMQWHMVL
jgi:hypothetical protein